MAVVVDGVGLLVCAVDVMVAVDGVGVLAIVPVSGKSDGEPGPGTTSAGVIVCGIAFVDVHKSCADLEVHVFDIPATGTRTVVPVPVYLLVAVTVYAERNGDLKKGK